MNVENGTPTAVTGLDEHLQPPPRPGEVIMDRLQDPRFAPADEALIKHKVRRVIGRFGINRADAEDLQQELWLHAVATMPRYDPNRSALSTFRDRVLSNRLRSLLAERRAGRRDYRRCAARDTAAMDYLLDPRSQPAAADRTIDVAQAVAELPPFLQQVTACLRSHNLSSSASVLGLSRQQLRRHRNVIRKHFSRSLAAYAFTHSPTKATVGS